MISALEPPSSVRAGVKIVKIDVNRRPKPAVYFAPYYSAISPPGT